MITVYMHSQNKCVWVSIINFLDFVSVLPPPRAPSMNSIMHKRGIG